MTKEVRREFAAMLWVTIATLSMILTNISMRWQ
jgi:hypothetical protein